MATNNTIAKPPPSEPPPEKINVQKFAESRAPELDSLHSIVSSRLAGDFRSHRSKRRRTTSFDNKSAGRRRKFLRRSSSSALAAASTDDRSAAGEKAKARVSRRARRREELKMNSATGFSNSGDGTRRLRTHVWHAKRFAMAKLWGYHLALGLHGRGKGSRSLLKRFRDGVLVHDASYHVAVQLDGPEGSLLSILSAVLETSPSDDDADVVISGAAYGNAMLCDVGGLCPMVIAPVTYMWQPCCLPKANSEVVSVSDQPENEESHSYTRRLWMWIHASAFNEGYDALKFACQKEMEQRGVLITCVSLEGQLAKLEVMGSKAFQLLQRTLTVAGISECSEMETRSVDNDSQVKKISLVDHGIHVSARSFLSFSVMDPRTMTKERKIVNCPESTSSDMFDDNHQTEAGDDDGNKDLFSFRLETSGNSTMSCTSLWDVSCGVNSPIEESVLCQEKHDLRKNFYCLGGPISTEVQCSRCCPIMLLKNENKKGLTIGWSVILPLSWVKAFWFPLVSSGAHAIGLRERHWISCDVGLPCFPSDFPDCNAYSHLKATEADASNLKRELRPPALRPLKVPIPPPWNCIRLTLNRILKRDEDPKISQREKQDLGYSLTDSEHVGHGDSMNGFVARTSCSLTKFLSEIESNHLLLFPQAADRNKCLTEVVKNENTIGRTKYGVANMIYDRKLCFLRVLLHAYKEGSFEDGAVICAPNLSDIKLFTSSLENDGEGLQIPQSVVATYFKEQSFGKWELHAPEDTAAGEPLRFPIGFVTTSFVRGSKKLVAEGFCEAVLLAHLRNEQWSDSPVKRRRKEIFVLVRNLRSSAYRLALASIVLEHNNNDLDYF